MPWKYLRMTRRRTRDRLLSEEEEKYILAAAFLSRRVFVQKISRLKHQTADFN